MEGVARRPSLPDDTSGPRAVRFGEFLVNLETGELHRRGKPVKLRPQPGKVLALLARRAGHLVTREEIQREVWGAEVSVSFEQSVNFCLKQVRAALGDEAENPHYVETLPRRGYRLIAPTEPAVWGAGPSRARWRGRGWLGLVAIALAALTAFLHLVGRGPPTPVPAGSPIRVAVLPFKTFANDPGQEFWADGLTEDVLTRLAQLEPERLSVIARSSATRYKATSKGVDRTGRELGVDYLLEGSVRRVGDRLRVSVQLVQVADQAHVWAESYEREAGDVRSLLDEIPAAVARRVGVTLAVERGRSATAGTSRPEAYEAYLRARYHLRSLTESGVRRGIAEFERAIALDPRYAAAYAGLAEAHYALSNMHVDPRQAMERSRAAARRAVALDDRLAQAHGSLALILAFYDWDWAGAEREFRRALALDPAAAETRAFYGVYLALVGRLDESLAELRRARETDPLSLLANSTLSFPLYLEGRYDEALAQSRRVLDLDADYYFAQIAVGMTYEARGDFPRAVAELRKALAMDDSPEIAAFLARAEALAGDAQAARRRLAGLESNSPSRYVSPYDLALVHEALGDTERTLDLLERAYEVRAEGMGSLKVDPRLRRLRAHPRFQALLRRMAFPS